MQSKLERPNFSSHKESATIERLTVKQWELTDTGLDTEPQGGRSTRETRRGTEKDSTVESTQNKEDSETNHAERS